MQQWPTSHLRADLKIETVLLLSTHGAGVVSLLLQVRLELRILILDEGLRDVRQAGQRQDRADVAEPRREVEGDLALPDDAAAAVGNQVREDVVADEAAELAERRGDAVVLPAHGGRAGLGGDQTDVVAGADFAQGEEDSGMG